MMDLKGKVALVTGGASGIGLTIIEEFLNHGIKGAVIADLNSESGEKVVNELTRKYGSGRVVFQKTDVSSQQEYEDAYKQTISKYGQLDILVNNAGIANDLKYEKQISVNLTGAMHGIALALKYMAKDKGGQGGAVLSISSITAIDDMQAIPVYGCTKVALMNLMRGFGHPFYYESTGIRMMSLLPSKTNVTSIGSDLGVFRDLKIAAQFIQSRPEQMPSAVARSAIHLIKHGESASAWVIEGNKLFLLEIPHWETYAKLVVDNIDE